MEKLFRLFGGGSGKVFGGEGRRLFWFLVSFGGSLPLSLLNMVLSLKCKSKKEMEGQETQQNHKSKGSHCPARSSKGCSEMMQ
jgi:hypothetical protein